MTSDLGELVVSTRFSSIYKNKARALKVTHVESVAKPHDPMCELAILRKLQVGRSAHIIELVSFEVARGVVTLQFPFYKQNMYQYVLKYYQKRRWNPYLLTEQGDSGSKLVNNLKIDYALDFFRQLADALSNLHEHKIIHRDVKLQNVMVDEDGPHDIPQLVLIDFGIAYDPETSQEAADSKITDVSTSIYKAPELLFSVKNYSSAADIWSLMVLVSQLFQTESSSDRFIPAFVSDGSEVLEQGSDIRLVSSIFEKLAWNPLVTRMARGSRPRIASLRRYVWNNWRRALHSEPDHRDKTPNMHATIS